LTRGKDTPKDKVDRLIDEYQRGRSGAKAAHELNIPIRTGYHIVEGYKRGSAIEKVEGKGDDDGKKPNPVCRIPKATNRKLDFLVESAVRTEEGIARIEGRPLERQPPETTEQRTTEKPPTTPKAAREETSVARPEEKEPETAEFMLGHVERKAMSEQLGRVDSKMDLAIGLGYASLGAIDRVERDVRIQGLERQNRPSSPPIEAPPIEAYTNEAQPDWKQLAAYQAPDIISKVNEVVLSMRKTTGEAWLKILDSGNKFAVEYSKSQARFLEKVATAAGKPVFTCVNIPESKPQAVGGSRTASGGVQVTAGGLRWINRAKPTAPTAADLQAQKRTAEEKAFREKECSESLEKSVREAAGVYYGIKSGNRDAAARLLKAQGWYIP
jgi:hypothetical protein